MSARRVWRSIIPLVLWGAGLAPAASQDCVGSAPVTTFRLTVRPMGVGGVTVPIRRLNNMPAGAHIHYQPVDLPADLKNDAKLALVMVPKSSGGQLTVLEPRAAAGSTEWTAPFSPQIMVLVFAPQGLDEKRLTNLVTKDDNLVSALADYADQTADLEAGLDAARELEEDANDDTRPARPLTPSEQAIFALVRALNPAVSSYNPLGAGRRLGAVTLTGRGIDAFFDNAGGFVPGGGILPGVKSWLMPDTEFRSVYGVADGSDSVTLCTQIQPRTRNRIAYLWAYRLTNAPAPAVTILTDTHVPAGMRVSVPVKLDHMADWPLLARVYEWRMVPVSGSTPALAVPVRPSSDERALRVDLKNFVGPAGPYRLEAKWDGEPFHPSGTFTLHKLGDLKAARVSPASQDQVVTGSGPVTVELTGGDLLFVDRASLHRVSSFHEIPLDLPPDRDSTTDSLRLEVDTDALRPAAYLLSLSRVDGATAEVPLDVLPPNPRIESKGLRVNLGEQEQTVTLAGSGLERIETLESDRAEITLAAAKEGGTRRNITVRLRADAKPGESLALAAKVSGRSGLLRFPGVLQVAAARPRIHDAKVSLPSDLVITPHDGELPASSWVNYAIRADAVEKPSLTLACAEASRTIQPETLRTGERHPDAQLTGSDDGNLFLSFEPGAIGQSGCTLMAVLESEATGKSDPFTLGKVVRFPRIESLTLSDEKADAGFYAVLKGFDLETIAKTGWDPSAGIDVPGLPQPLAGEGAKQTLRVVMPWPSPSPKAPLLIWLRGESEPRPTKVTP
jgi:hypothetical protein